jgi:hypothetical protein
MNPYSTKITYDEIFLNIRLLGFDVNYFTMDLLLNISKSIKFFSSWKLYDAKTSKP